jgi:hypothetical protein
MRRTLEISARDLKYSHSCVFLLQPPAVAALFSS